MKQEKANIKNDTKDNKKIALRTIIVLIVLVSFALISCISLRARYLKTIEIGQKYADVFYNDIKNKYTVWGVIFISLYLFMYVNNKFIKSGLQKFFDDEKKEMPKLPNKSLSIIVALIGATIGANILAEKFAIFINAAVFGKVDPVFNADIGYYLFTIPFIQSLLVFLIEICIFFIGYTGIYYVISLNKFFDGIDVETLKKNIFIKQEIFFVIIITLIVCVYIFILSQNILTQSMVSINDENSTELVGAGKTDVTIKLWGYRTLSVFIAVSVLRLIKYIKEGNFKQSMISVLIVPSYFLCLFIVMTYFQLVHIKNNELDNEKKYIGYNINNTKEAYGIDIEQKNIDSYDTITLEEVNHNKTVVDNIPLITKDITLKSVVEHQENSSYYSYENSFLSIYNIDNNDKVVYVTPREIINDLSTSYNNRTLKYTHGYSTIISSSTDSDNNGYAEYILSDFESDKMNIIEPRIYFGLNTNSTIVVNTSFGKEYDYPITPTTYKENVYEGTAGLNLGFADRLVLGISEKNLKLAFSSYIDENSKIITNRNVMERAKSVLPYIIYDENPYLVITDEGKLVWVIDGYTISSEYPYSQSTIININGNKEKINYIKNSVKVLVDAYDGTIKFYITDRSDPIIMTYRNMYPSLFEDLEEEISQDIKNHFVYPEFLYKIQSQMLNIYHDVSEDVLYRADDIWQITTKVSTKNSSILGVEIEPYYTMLKINDIDNPKLGLMITYNKLGKQNITSYLVGTVDNGKNKLSLYKFNSESNVVGIMQFNNQIEQDETISKELESLNTTGTKLIKDMLIVPINNTLLYVEPVYQVMLNEKEIPVLKKVIVASGNTVAIGDNLEESLTNLFNDYAVDLEFVDVENIEELIDSVIKANNNLTDSLNSNNFEMIGKDISSLQNLIKQLENAREKQLEEDKENENNKEENDSQEILLNKNEVNLVQ